MVIRMTERAISDEDLDKLVRLIEEATTAFLNGDMERYLELTSHATGFTLANPFGGAPLQYEDRSESIREAAGFFQGSGTLLVALLANLRRLALLFGLLGFLCSLRSLLFCESGLFRSTTLCE